jgi:hypothetical protein
MLQYFINYKFLFQNVAMRIPVLKIFDNKNLPEIVILGKFISKNFRNSCQNTHDIAAETICIVIRTLEANEN